MVCRGAAKKEPQPAETTDAAASTPGRPAGMVSHSGGEGGRGGKARRDGLAFRNRNSRAPRGFQCNLLFRKLGGGFAKASLGRQSAMYCYLF